MDAKAGEDFITMPIDLDMRGNALDQAKEELGDFVPRHSESANCRMMGRSSRLAS
jgi:hypothetical protein